MAIGAGVDTRLAAAWPAAVAREAADLSPGWVFGHGAPPLRRRWRLVLLYARRLPWAWRRAGWRAPTSWLFAATVMVLVVWTVEIAVLTDTVLHFVVAMLAFLAVCGVLVAAVWLLATVVVPAWRLSVPAGRTILWCHGPRGLAVAFGKLRRDGAWFASDFVSTGRGEGAHLVRIATALAADLNLTIELTAVGALVPYYRAYGFVPVAGPSLFGLIRLRYLPSREEAAGEPAAGR